MKRMKKGFTIVELVIVIAVIGILAAVLIPTFSSVAKKARINADTQVVRNLNTSLSAAEAVDGKPENFGEVRDVLRNDGYVIANLNPTTDGWFYVWESESNQMLLVDENYDIQYKAKDLTATEPGATWYFAISNEEAANKVETELPAVNVERAYSSAKDLKDALASGGNKTIYIDESFEIDSQNQVAIESGEITIKLPGVTVAANNNTSYNVDNIPFLVDGGKLTIDGGVISATGSWLDADNEPVDSAVLALDGEFNLKNAEVRAEGKTIVLAYAGANGVVSNVTITAKSSAINIGGNSDVIIENCTVNVDNEAVWVSNSGATSSSATIKSGSYNGVGNVVALYGGEVVIEGGAFTAQKANMFKFYNTGSSITIKGGTFTTLNGTYSFAELNETILQGMMSGSSVGTVTVTKNADGSFTIAN